MIFARTSVKYLQIFFNFFFWSELVRLHIYTVTFLRENIPLSIHRQLRHQAQSERFGYREVRVS